MSLSALVIDDEDWIRLGLVSKLKKSNLNVSFIEEAACGSEALQRAKYASFDIAICDIRLGDMSGLDLCEKLLTLIPDIKIIIISGYNDFSYAQQAISLGVVDYLLKPVSSKALNTALEKCLSSIRKKQKILHTESLLQTIRKCREIRTLLTKKDFPNKELETFFPEILRSYHKYGSVYLYVDEDIDISINDLSEWCLSNYAECQGFIYCEIKAREFVFFLAPGESSFSEQADNLIRALKQMLCQYFREPSDSQYTFGVSDICHDLRTAYLQALRNTKHRIFCSPKTILHTQDIQPYLNAQCNLATDFFQFRHAIQQKNAEALTKLLREFYLSIADLPVTYDYLQTFYLHMKIMLKTLETPNTAFTNYPEEIYIFSSVWEFVDFLMNTFQYFLLQEKSPSAEPENPQSNIIKDLCAHIEANYATMLSLHDFSKNRHISYCYLSLLFKETTGTTFQDYVMSVRLKKACQLLLDPSNKIKDVATATGFNDQHYFSKAFKKKIGCTPKEYQTQNTL